MIIPVWTMRRGEAKVSSSLSLFLSIYMNPEKKKKRGTEEVEEKVSHLIETKSMSVSRIGGSTSRIIQDDNSEH